MNGCALRSSESEPFPLVLALHEGEHVVVRLGEEEDVVVEPDDGADVEVGREVEERVLVRRLVLPRLLDPAALQKPTRRPPCNRTRFLISNTHPGCSF